MECPNCGRYCHNFASIRGHGVKCCPEFIKGPVSPALEGSVSWNELGLIQLKLKAAITNKTLPEELEGMPDYLIELFEGSAADGMTRTQAGVIMGMLAPKKPKDEDVKPKFAPGGLIPPTTHVEWRFIKPDGALLQHVVMPAGVTPPPPMGLYGPWKMERLMGGRWVTMMEKK